MTTTVLAPRGVDFHCHLDLFPDHAAAIAAAESAGIYTLTVTTTPKAWPRNRDLTASTRYVRAALGLHPQLIAERSGELADWKRYATETRYIGEVGLDAGPRFYKFFDEQKRVFRAVLECCADYGDKILTVHSIRSAPVVLDMIEAHLPPDRGKVVLHWFTGSRAEARRAVSLGCYFSVNAQMMRSERSRAIVEELPSDRLLTETDGPFTKTGNRPSQPSDVHLALSLIASARKTDPQEVSNVVHANLKTLVS